MNTGEYDYLDDDFDLPASTIKELDKSAATLSQRLPQRLVGHAPVGESINKDAGGPRQSAVPQPPSSDYGFNDDDDVFDLDAAPDPGFLQDASIGQGGPSRPADNHVAGHIPYNVSDPAAQRLQARIAELERQCSSLQKEVDSVQSDATAKAGAISILRSKHEKSTKEFERRLAVMQQLHADEITKQKNELELARKDQETTETSNRFLEHDLAQELEKSKKLQAPKSAILDAGPLGAQAPRALQTTNGALHYSDGFSHDEVMLISPPRAKSGNKDVTPKLARKRKRAAESSPVIPLDLEAPMDVVPVISAAAVEPAERRDRRESRLLRQLRARDESLETLRQVTQHTFPGSHIRTIEELAKYVFPDAAGRTVANMFLADLSTISADENTPTAMAICTTCLGLWERCLVTQYYLPLVALLDLLQTLLFRVAISHQHAWIKQMVRLTSKTVDLIAVPRALSVRGTVESTKEEARRRRMIEDFVDDDAAIDLLHTTACSARTTHATTRDFWKAMEFDFVLLMMHKTQPMHQITSMLEILSTSVLPDSFGVIDAAGKRQAAYQSDLLDRLTLLLFEDLVVPDDEPAYSRNEYADLRVQVLQAIRSVSATASGSRALAEHKTAVGRLIRFLHAQMMYLYEVPVSFDNGDESLHDRVMRSINLTTRITYHLLREQADLISIRDKVSVIHGGWHKFLVALSRIAFSERVAFEAGLEDDVVDAAHEILDAVLSPEEGDAIVMAVRTPRAVGVGNRAAESADAIEEKPDEVMT